MLDLKAAIQEVFEGKVSSWWLRNEVKKGNIPHIRIGQRILFRKSSLMTYLAEKEKLSLQKEQPTAYGRLRQIQESPTKIGRAKR